MSRSHNHVLGHYARRVRDAFKQHAAKERESTVNNRRRRKFLEYVGKAGVSSKLLHASAVAGGIFSTRYAQANNEPTKRLVYCYLPGGAANGYWLPTAVDTMNVCTEPYGPDGYDVAGICHFREVNVLMHGHASARQALGVLDYTSPTMDQRLASLLNVYTPHSHLYVGVKASAGQLCSTIGPCINGVEPAYQHIFRKTIRSHRFDTMMAHHQMTLQQIQSKLSLEEQQRLEQHAQALAAVAKQLDATDNLDACPLVQPNLPGENSGNFEMQEHGRAMVDLLVSALQCGLTNLATLQLSTEAGDWRMPEGSTFLGDFHAAQAGAQTVEPFNAMVAHLSDVPAYFIKQLITKKDAEGAALIDSTVFAQVSCMGSGRDHSPENSPFILATKMPGFKPGFSAQAAGNTQDFNGAIPRGMGLDESQYEPMGEQDLGLLA